jgi:hypothetical protein
MEAEVGGLTVDVEGERTNWSGEPHNEVFCSVEIVKHLQRVLIIELSWVAHRTREVADCESNVCPKLRRWVKQLSNERLITLCKLCWSDVVLGSQAQLERL